MSAVCSINDHESCTELLLEHMDSGDQLLNNPDDNGRYGVAHTMLAHTHRHTHTQTHTHTHARAHTHTVHTVHGCGKPYSLHESSCV